MIDATIYVDTKEKDHYKAMSKLFKDGVNPKQMRVTNLPKGQTMNGEWIKEIRVIYVCEGNIKVIIDEKEDAELTDGMKIVINPEKKYKIFSNDNTLLIEGTEEIK